jgi:hypothetical protein
MAFTSSYTEHVSVDTYLVHVFYTLKHVLCEMIEIAPPYYNMNKTYSCKCIVT